VTDPDVFAKCIALAPGEILDLRGEDEQTFFNWRFPAGDHPRTDIEVHGFLRAHDLKMDRNHERHCWRVWK
jgi:hypothetical protein